MLSYDNNIFYFIRKMPNFYLKWLYHFAFLLAIYERSVLFAASEAFGIVRSFTCSLSSRYVGTPNCGFNLHFLNVATVFMFRNVHATSSVKPLVYESI